MFCMQMCAHKEVFFAFLVSRVHDFCFLSSGGSRNDSLARRAPPPFEVPHFSMSALPSTPQRGTPLRNSTSTNTPTVQPWSRTTSKRFEGSESIYPKTPTANTPRGGAKTPKRVSNHTPGVDRYATPDERARDTTPAKPNAVFASTTDRFTEPGGHVTVSAAPAVGTYKPVEQTARVRGVVKLQAAVRRRQSRGVFVQLQECKITPGPLEYNPTMPAAVTAGSTSAAFAKPTTQQGERFIGGSIYGTSTPGLVTPGAGAYNPALPSVGENTGSAACAAFRGDENRFAAGSHNSMYTLPASSLDTVAMGGTAASDAPASALAQPSAAFAPTTLGRAANRFAGPNGIHAAAAAATPGAGTYDVDVSGVAQKIIDASRPTFSASFASSSERFRTDDPGSYLATSAAPGVGTYVPVSASAIELPHQDSTFASSTDRFTVPGAYVVLTAAPGVGTYHVSDELQAARVRGAVKLQAAIRRRQSRGVFAALEKEARDTPGPGEYEPTLLPSLAKTRMPNVRPPAHAPTEAAPAEADAAEAAAAVEVSFALELPTVLGSLAEEAAPEEAAQIVECHMVHEAFVEPTLEERLAAMSVDVSGAGAVQFVTDATALAASPVVREPPRGQRLSRVVSLDVWLAESDDDEQPEPPAERDFTCFLPTGCPAEPSSERLSMASVLSDAADGDWLFSQLKRMATDAEVSKGDYFTDGEGWDLEGLREDLQLYMKQAGAVEIV